MGRWKPPRELGRYRVISADPPWSFDDAGSRMSPDYKGDGRSEFHYEVMCQDHILDLGWWVRAISHPDCILMLWSPNAMVLDGTATATARAWGFEPKQLIPWIKTDKTGKPRLGGGHYTRVVSEQLILCRRGSVKVRDRGVAGVIMAQRAAHSAKPDESYALIERLLRGPYLELFARRRYSPAWDVWGNEVEGSIPGPFHSGR